MKCPGQDSRFWKLDAIFDVKCPHCGSMIEFFKDDTKRRCPSCGQDVPNPQMDFGCAAYCPYAEHCLGSLPEGEADAKLKILKAEMLKLIRQKVEGDSGKMAKATRIMELSEAVGKIAGIRLGPFLMASFLACLQHFSQVKTQDPTDVLKQLDTDPEASSEAEAIFEQFHNEEFNSLETRVLKDVFTIFETENDPCRNCRAEGLLTEAAQEFARTINL